MVGVALPAASMLPAAAPAAAAGAAPPAGRGRPRVIRGPLSHGGRRGRSSLRAARGRRRARRSPRAGGGPAAAAGRGCGGGRGRHRAAPPCGQRPLQPIKSLLQRSTAVYSSLSVGLSRSESRTSLTSVRSRNLDGLKRSVELVVDADAKIAAYSEARWLFAMISYHFLFEAAPFSAACSACFACSESTLRTYRSLH